MGLGHDPPKVFLSEFFEDWVTRRLGLTESPLRSLENDDDWTFVIKMHAVVEAALNHLLMVRVNDPKLLTGSSRYVDDIELPGLAHGAIIRSTVAHGRIRGIDASAARAE